jgi:hypothetical protein
MEEILHVNLWKVCHFFRYLSQTDGAAFKRGFIHKNGT